MSILLTCSSADTLGIVVLPDSRSYVKHIFNVEYKTDRYPKCRWYFSIGSYSKRMTPQFSITRISYLTATHKQFQLDLSAAPILGCHLHNIFDPQSTSRSTTRQSMFKFTSQSISPPMTYKFNPQRHSRVNPSQNLFKYKIHNYICPE